MPRLVKHSRVVAFAVLGGCLLAVALWPAAVPVDVEVTSRGPLTVTVDEEGQTRIRRRFVVSAPVTGRVLRIELEPGDRVRRGDVVARVRPELPPLLDARTQAEARAAVDNARAALGRAQSEDARAKEALVHAERELARATSLSDVGTISAQGLDARQTEVRLASEAVHASAYAVEAASAELQRARARLAPASAAQGVVTVRAPIDGAILRRLRESESIVPAGEPLLEVGDPRALEIVADLLSTDAVYVKPGARAFVEQWGQDTALEATVRLVEPSGFTKISALGVEEQRVNVVLDFTDLDKASALLGDAYRVELRIVVWDSTSVVKVPVSALVRDGERWAVFELRGGRARRVLVELGHRGGREAEVVSGLSEGTRVVVHPSDRVDDGVRVAARPSNSPTAP
jgi:HlyD family secretion protein